MGKGVGDSASAVLSVMNLEVEMEERGEGPATSKRGSCDGRGSG